MSINMRTSPEWRRLPVSEFSKVQAMAYMDDCLITRRVGAVTYNNNIRHLRSVFAELVKRGYLAANPFSETPYKTKKAPKIRRNFSQAEAQVVIHRIRQDEPLLFLALLLEYCCFIRPSEIRRLRFEDINLEEGSVSLTFDRSKDWENRVMTIPPDFLPYFDRAFLGKYPKRYFIFGKDFQPHALKVCGKGTMYRKHQKILTTLKGEGLLWDIAGLQWYSWKDTGITDALAEVPILGVQDQAGHSTPDVTLKYRHKKSRNEMIAGWKNKVVK